MRNWIVITTAGTMIVIAGTAQAQIQHRVSLRPPMTPAERTDFYRTAALTRDATSAMHSGDYAEAESYARASLASGLDAGFAHETLAAALDAQGKTQEALQAYKVIAEAGGIFPRNLLPYALLSLKVGDWQQAVSAYNKALPLLDNGDIVRRSSNFAPNVPNPTALAAAIHIALGLQSDWRGYHGTYQEMNQQTLVQFHQASMIEPSSPLANYGYGLKRLGRRAEAQKAFQKAATLGQGDIKEAARKELPETMRPK